MKKMLIFLVFLFLFGCASQQTISQTSIPSIQPTFTLVVPSNTVTPPHIPTTTPFPPTSTPVTPIPTLLPKEQESYLLNLIESNGGCKLPCFLGLQPGVSTWEDVRKVEAPLYFREKYTPANSNSSLLYTYIEKRIDNFDVTLLGTGNTIEQIKVDARIYLPNEYSHREKFAQAMASYSLPNILLEYGVPSRILLQVQGQAEPNSGTQTEILLFYDQLGVVAHYFFENVVIQDSKTGILRTCPNYEHISFIKFYLQNSGADIPLERMIDDEKSYYLNSWLHPIEKITALSVDDFYNLFSDPNKTACFDVP